MEYGVIINNDITLGLSRIQHSDTALKDFFFSKICFIKIIGVGLQTYG